MGGKMIFYSIYFAFFLLGYLYPENCFIFPYFFPKKNKPFENQRVVMKKAERLGLEPRRRLPADRLAICSVTTPAPLHKLL